MRLTPANIFLTRESAEAVAEPVGEPGAVGCGADGAGCAAFMAGKADGDGEMGREKAGGGRKRCRQASKRRENLGQKGEEVEPAEGRDERGYRGEMGGQRNVGKWCMCGGGRN